MTGKSPFSQIDHTAIIVNNMEQATQYYHSLGMGPFQPVVVSLAGREVRGKTVTDVKNKASLGSVGYSMIELVEPLEGTANIYKEYRDSKGEGVQHVCFSVEDISQATAEVEVRGVKVLSKGKFSTGGGYTYFDTAAIGGIILELMQWAPGFNKPVVPKQTTFAKLDHIGVIVKDKARAIKHYESIGIGPFFAMQGVLSVEKKVNGKPIDPNSIRLDVAMARVGSAKFEVIQPVVGESIWKEFVDTHGEGVSHIGFFVKNVFDEVARLKKKGYKALYEAKFEGGGGAVYFDTRKVGGVIIELLEWSPTANVR